MSTIGPQRRNPDLEKARTPMHRTMILLAIILASAPVAVGQDVSSELYGDFRYSYAYVGTGDTTHWGAVNNASRLGVRGDVSGRSLTAFFDLQTGINIGAVGGAFTQRYYFAGVRGSFGAITVGRHSTAYKMAGLRLDSFYDTSTLSAGGGTPSTGLFAGASFGLSNLTNGWANRTVAYTSPSIRGITANAAAYVDTDSDHHYGLGLGYRDHGIDAGLQYYDAGGEPVWAQTAGINHALRLHAAYTRSDAWSAGASYERLEAAAGPAQSFFYVAATLTVMRRVLIAGAVGHVEDTGAVQAVTGTAYHAGVFYTLLQRVRLHALYSHLDADSQPRRNDVALGLTVDFSADS